MKNRMYAGWFFMEICWIDLKENSPVLFRSMATQYVTDQGTWTIYKYGTRQRKAVLVDSVGHTYTSHNSHRQRPYWLCVRQTLPYCNARVTQFGSSFVVGKKPHHHDPDSKLISLCQIKHAIAKKDRVNPFIPAKQIVDEVLLERKQLNLPIPATVRASQLCYDLSRYRKRHRAYPSDLINFTLNKPPPDFVLVDLKVYGHHLILGTRKMVAILHQCKHWYIDCHKYFVEEPATVVTISAFLRKDDLIVHEPLLYCIISKSDKRDYQVVFKCILKLMNGSYSATDVTVGFEKDLWRALHKVLPDVSLHGCHFAFRQQLWKVAGVHKCATHTNQTLKKLIVVPFLPPEDIFEILNSITVENMSQNGKHLMGHLGMIGVGSLINHYHLSVYQKPIRMKVDVEGWLSTLCGKEDTPYGSIAALIDMLHERSVINDSYVPVSDRKVKKFQRKNTDSVTSELWRAWKLREQGHLNAEQLQGQCVSVLPLPYAEWCMLQSGWNVIALLLFLYFFEWKYQYLEKIVIRISIENRIAGFYSW